MSVDPVAKVLNKPLLGYLTTDLHAWGQDESMQVLLRAIRKICVDNGKKKPRSLSITKIHLDSQVSGSKITPLHEGFYRVEVFTPQGHRRFHGEEITRGDAQSDADPIGPSVHTVRTNYRHLCATPLDSMGESTWKSSTSPLRDRASVAVKLKAVTRRPPTATSVVQALGNEALPSTERRNLVIEAEALDFTADQASILIPLLRKFINDHRDSNDPIDLVAVGSAIRKFVAIAPIDVAFNHAATLLKVGAHAPLPIGLELELAKMVVRKLTVRTPETDGLFPDLSDRLWELADTYLKPRLLGREKHAAVALNAVLGLVLTRSPHSSPVCAAVRDLGVPWFQELVSRRAGLLRSDIERRNSDHRFNAILDRLSRLSPIAVA